MLDLFNVEKPAKWGKYWLQNGDEGGDNLQMSLNTPFEGKYFEDVQWEDNEPLKVSLVPNKLLAQCDSTRKNMERSLERLHLALAHKSVKEVCETMNEIERFSAQAIDVLSKLNKYKEE